MDVRLPDGTVITNVPEGTTQSELMTRLGKMDAKPYELKLDNVGTSKADAAAYGGGGANANVATQLYGGAKHAWDRAAYGLKDVLPKLAQTPSALVRPDMTLAEVWNKDYLSDEEKALLKQGKAFVQETGPASTVGEIGGDILTTGGAVGRAMKAAKALPMAVRALAPAAVGAAAGGITQPEDRTTGAAAGALGGVAGQALQRVTGGLVKPLVTAEGRELMSQGIQPTVGQAVSGQGAGMLGRAINTAEQRLTSVPLVGEMVAKGRNRAVGEWNEALVGQAANRAEGTPLVMPRDAARALVTDAEGKVGQAAGDEGLLALRDKIGDIYETVLETVPNLRIEPTRISSTLQEIADDPALGLSDASIERLKKYVQKNLLGHGPDLTGKVAKRIESDLGKAAYRFQTGTVGEEAAYGEALKRLHTAWRESLEGSLPERARNSLQDANAAWRGLQQIDKAGAYASSADRGGVYTPRVLRQAMKAQDKSQGDNALRRAMKEAPAQPFAQAPWQYAASMTRAGQALGDTVPDSGTAGRMISNTLGAVGLGTGALTGVLPQMLAGGAAASAAYSRVGSQLLTQGLQSFAPAKAKQITEKIIADAARRGIPEEVILSQGQNFIRSLFNHYANQGQGQ